MRPIKPFHFKQFLIHHDQCAMKVGTDGVLLGAWADVKADQAILDIGTGSGVIAIMLAQRNALAKITGIEIDQAAAQQAQQNAILSPWAERLEIQGISLQEFTKISTKPFNHIISNPPFFQEGTSTTSKERNMARQTGSLSFEEIIIYSNTLLAKNGKLSVILPPLEASFFIKLALKHHFFIHRKLNVQAKKEKSVERILMEFTRNEVLVIEEENLIIQHEQRNDWTDDYIELTGDFYLKM